MTRQKRLEMGRDPDRTNPRAATTVGNAEGLVQIQMADIGAKGTGAAHPHLGIEVGAIEIHLASVLMHQRADLSNPGFKHPVGGGIGDHQGRQHIGVLLGFGSQVLHIHVAVVITGHSHHAQSSHHRTGGVGAMGTGGNEAHIALGLAAGPMPRPDHQQAGVLPLGAGIGLQ